MIYHFPDGSETDDRTRARRAWVFEASKLVRYARLGKFKLPGETWDAAVMAAKKAGEATGKLFDEVYREGSSE